MLDLYTWEPNSNSGKPIFALKEKGLDFKYHYIDLLNFEQHAPDYLKLNPSGTVPTLVHDGKLLTESTQLCEYIDAAFEGPSLRPEDPEERYQMRYWCRYIDVHYAPSLSVLGWHSFMGPMVRKKDPEEVKRLIARIPTKERRIAWSTAIGSTFSEAQLDGARRRIESSVHTMDARLKEKPYFAGRTFSVADIVAFANCYALPVSQPAIANDEKVPHFMDWLRRVYRRPATKESFALGRTQLSERAVKLVEEYNA